MWHIVMGENFTHHKVVNVMLLITLISPAKKNPIDIGRTEGFNAMTSMHTKRHASRVSSAHDIQALFINKQRPDGSKLFDLLEQDPVGQSAAGKKAAHASTWLRLTGRFFDDYTATPC